MTPGVAGTTADPGPTLRDSIERGYPSLRRGVEVLVWRRGFVAGREPIRALAEEILHEAIARGLSRAASFDATRSAHAWLLGIAVNILREHHQRQARDQRRAVSLDRPIIVGEDGADCSLAERLSDPAAHDAIRLTELLDLVEPADRNVLRLAFVEGRRGRALGEALGISEGAARVRQSRALKRLADSYRRAEGDA